MPTAAGCIGRPIISPDPCQCGLVLDAVKAWPGSAGARLTCGATASLDGVSTRGQRQSMGRDEETGLSGRTKKLDARCSRCRPHEQPRQPV